MADTTQFRNYTTRYDPGMGLDLICDALNLGLYIGVDAAADASPTISSAIIKFLQSGSGAVASDVQTEIRNLGTSLKQYGAKGDGTTDDAAALQLVLNQGGRIYGVAGTYIIGSQLTIKSNTTLICEKGCIFKRKDNTSYTTPYMIINQNWSDVPFTDSNIVINGLEINGNKATQAVNDYASGISIRSAQHVRIENCVVHENGGKTSTGHGIDIERCKDVTLLANECYSNDGDGIDFYAQNIACVAIGNACYSNGAIGIESEGRVSTDYTNYRCYNISIIGNKCYSNTDHNILVAWTDDSEVIGNTSLSSSGGMGIEVLGCNRVTVDDNAVRSNTGTSKYGIAVTSETYGSDGYNSQITISGNVLHENTNGIELIDSSNVTVSGNQVYKNSDTCIILNVDGTSSNVTVCGNTLNASGGGTGILLDDAVNGVNITSNTIKGGNGVLFGVSSGTYTNVNINDNIFDGCTNGIYAFPSSALVNGGIRRNIFKNIVTKDLNGDSGGYAVLSSFFVQDNILDQGIQFWDSVGGGAPSNGTWKVGDKSYAASPSAGGTIGWVCTTAGTPGTWKTFGSIAA